MKGRYLFGRILIPAMLLAASLPIGTACASSFNSEPDTTVSVRPLDTVWSDTRMIFTDAWLLFSSPARFAPSGWGILGGTVAGAGLASLGDSVLRARFTGGHNPTKDALADFGDLYGVGLPTLGISGGMYLGGLIFDAPGLRLGGLHVFQSALYAGFVTTVMKYVIGRHRPFLNDGVYSFSPLSFSDDYNSFPSGHTTMAFALSSALAAEIGHPVATAGLYALATLTALSRIYHDRHWLSDTFMGACVGSFIGYATVHLHDPSPEEPHSFRLIPSPDGISFVWMF